MSNGTQNTATTNAKPKRARKAPGPMTPTKALGAITKIRDKATADEAAIVSQLNADDAKRVQAFLEVK